MSDHRFTILIVDDVEENRLLLELMLEDDYDLRQAGSGQACLDEVAREAPDLVLLDITMPDLDGYEVCRRLKQASGTADIPIIFVSARVTAEERLAGFEAGCDEFVTKPVSDIELAVKLARSLENRVVSLALQASAAAAIEQAKEAKVSSSELNLMNQFMRESSLAENYEELGKCLLDMTRELGLNCSVRFDSRAGTTILGCDSMSLEASLLEKNSNRGDFIEFQHRLVANCKRCSLLVKNMPINEPITYQRLRDHLALLMEALEGKIEAIELSLGLQEQQAGLVAALLETNENQLQDICRRIESLEQSRRMIMLELLMTVENQLFKLGLDEDQEKWLMSQLDDGVQKVEQLPDFSKEIHSSFHQARLGLTKILTRGF